MEQAQLLSKSIGDARPVDRGNGTDGTAVARRPARLRTFGDLDGRTRAAKLAQRLVADLEADLGGDPSTAQRELIKRAALLGAIVEDADVL